MALAHAWYTIFLQRQAGFDFYPSDWFSFEYFRYICKITYETKRTVLVWGVPSARVGLAMGKDGGRVP